MLKQKSDEDGGSRILQNAGDIYIYTQRNHNKSHNTKILSDKFSCPVFGALSFFYSQEILKLLQDKAK
jgi:hypothetical protein